MPDPQRYGRLILVLGCAACASSLAGRAFDPLVGVIGAEFGVAAASVALLGTAFALPYALVQPVLGPVGDALGKERVMRACLVVLAAALAASAFAPDLGTLAAVRVVAGGAAGGVFPLAIAVVGDRVPIERRQVALARLIVAGLTGSVAGGALGALAAPLIGWRGVTLACAAVAIGALPLLRGAGPAGGRLQLAEAVARYRAIIGSAAARALYIAVFVEGALFHGVFPFLAPLFAARSGGTGAAEAGWVIIAFAAGGFVFAALAPALLRGLGQGRMVMLGGAMGAAGFAGLAAAPTAAAGAAGMLVAGLGFYMIHSSIQTRVTEVAPGARGSAVALHAFSFFLGQSLGPVLMGGMRAALGAEPAIVAAAVGLLVLSVWLARGWAR